MYIVDEFSYTKIENRSILTEKESIERGLENLRKFYKLALKNDVLTEKTSEESQIFLLFFF